MFKKQMLTSNPFSLAVAAKQVRDAKFVFSPFTYKFSLTDLQPSLGEPFSYFTQASWTFFSPAVRSSVGSKSSDVPVLSALKETTLNERVITNE
jgi:hypothetical protein